MIKCIDTSMNVTDIDASFAENRHRIELLCIALRDHSSRFLRPDTCVRQIGRTFSAEIESKGQMMDETHVRGRVAENLLMHLLNECINRDRDLRDGFSLPDGRSDLLLGAGYRLSPMAQKPRWQVRRYDAQSAELDGVVLNDRLVLGIDGTMSQHSKNNQADRNKNFLNIRSDLSLADGPDFNRLDVRYGNKSHIDFSKSTMGIWTLSLDVRYMVECIISRVLNRLPRMAA